MRVADLPAVAKAAGVQLPSLLSLQIGMSVSGHDLAQGTGFMVVDQGLPYLMTNRHNLTGRNNETGAPLSPTAATPDTVHVMHNLPATVAGEREYQFEWESRAEPLYDPEGKPLWFEHPTHGPVVDVVALRLHDVEGVILAAYPVHRSPHPIGVGVSQELSIVGFPFGVSTGGSMAVWIRGAIASEPIADWAGLPRFLVDARTRPGQSGSPVVLHSASGVTNDGRGITLGTGPSTQLVGVYSGRINAQSDLGIVWKAHVIGQILAQVGPPKDTSPLMELPGPN